eukprot:m.751551 g.751551  ORF g.751551 m.751551 type:complete len:138 (-) comp23168_c0_seq7:1376-1789(-)
MKSADHCNVCVGWTNHGRNNVSVVTDHISRINNKGIELKSGSAINTDVIVFATGLNLSFLGKIQVSVDGQPVTPQGKLVYQGHMLSNMPNAFAIQGYINSSWTLKVDLVRVEIVPSVEVQMRMWVRDQGKDTLTRCV